MLKELGRHILAGSLLLSPLAANCSPGPREVSAESAEVAATATAPPKEKKGIWVPKEKETPFGKHELRYSIGDVEKQSGELIITVDEAALKAGKVFEDGDHDDLRRLFAVWYGFGLREDGKLGIVVAIGLPHTEKPINRFIGKAQVNDLEAEHEIRVAWEEWEFAEVTFDGEKIEEILPEPSGPVI